MEIQDTQKRETLSMAETQAFGLKTEDPSRDLLASSPSLQEYDCPVCDSSKRNLLYKPWVPVTDPVQLYGAASGVQGTQYLVQCTSCDMIYESPRYPEDVILKGYMSSQESDHDSQYKMRVESFYRTLVKLQSHLPPKGSRILDIGTAGGAFLEAATRFGYIAEGLEPSRYLVESGKKRGLNIHHGTIQNNQIGNQKYDMVCMWDVLEHVFNPKSEMLAMKNLIRPGGLLFINFPDIGTWQAKIAGKKFWWILSVHLHHFSRKTLSHLAALTGYKVKMYKPYWQTLQFGYLIGIAEKLKIPTAGFFLRVLPKFILDIPVSYYASQTSAILTPKEGQ